MNTDRRHRPDDSGTDSDNRAIGAGTESATEAEADIDGGAKAQPEGIEDEASGEKPQGRREVVVPRELYKIVTVFSTLIAIGAVVGGFVLLDTATNRTQATASEVNLPLAIVGVGLIVLGAATYAFASRFRTQGMGSPNNDADENSDNG